MPVIREQLDALDEITSQGAMLDALERFYAPECTFTEASNGARRENRRDQHDFLSGFFATLKGFNGATMHRNAVDGNLTYSEWTFDMTAADGSSIIWNEVLVRRWHAERVVEEKFYNASA